ncbi:MAG: hypothetical protein WA139_03135 [Candidatus Aenigmatarchaeota archaeon]
MNKKHLWVLARLMIIVIPVILAFFILFNPYERIPLSREKILENVTMIKVSEDVIFQPSLKNAIRGVFDVPFDLKWYDICFVNNDTKIIFENGETDKNVSVSLNFNYNQTILIIPYGETKCILYKFNKDFTYYWRFEAPINFTRIAETSKEERIYINETHYLKRKGTWSLHPDVDSYAKPEMSSIIVKNILFFFAWFSFYNDRNYKFCKIWN